MNQGKNGQSKFLLSKAFFRITAIVGAGLLWPVFKLLFNFTSWLAALVTAVLGGLCLAFTISKIMVIRLDSPKGFRIMEGVEPITDPAVAIMTVLFLVAIPFALSIWAGRWLDPKVEGWFVDKEIKQVCDQLEAETVHEVYEQGGVAEPIQIPVYDYNAISMTTPLGKLASNRPSYLDELDYERARSVNEIDTLLCIQPDIANIETCRYENGKVIYRKRGFWIIRVYDWQSDQLRAAVKVWAAEPEACPQWHRESLSSYQTKPVASGLAPWLNKWLIEVEKGATN